MGVWGGRMHGEGFDGRADVWEDGRFGGLFARRVSFVLGFMARQLASSRAG